MLGPDLLQPITRGDRPRASHGGDECCDATPAQTTALESLPELRYGIARHFVVEAVVPRDLELVEDASIGIPSCAKTRPF